MIVVAVTAIASLAVSAATASPKKHQAKKSSQMLVGINDEANTLYGDPTLRDTQHAARAGSPRQSLLGRQQVRGRQHEADRSDRS